MSFDENGYIPDFWYVHHCYGGIADGILIFEEREYAENWLETKNPVNYTKPQPGYYGDEI
jgi:hypothetical protein